jgi:hypothetical protein
MPIPAAHKTKILHGFTILLCASLSIVPNSAYDLVLAPYGG